MDVLLLWWLFDLFGWLFDLVDLFGWLVVLLVGCLTWLLFGGCWLICLVGWLFGLVGLLVSL